LDTCRGRKGRQRGAATQSLAPISVQSIPEHSTARARVWQSRTPRRCPSLNTGRMHPGATALSCIDSCPTMRALVTSTTRPLASLELGQARLNPQQCVVVHESSDVIQFVWRSTRFAGTEIPSLRKPMRSFLSVVGYVRLLYPSGGVNQGPPVRPNAARSRIAPRELLLALTFGILEMRSKRPPCGIVLVGWSRPAPSRGASRIGAAGQSATSASMSRRSSVEALHRARR